jgi:hypothetical protein
LDPTDSYSASSLVDFIRGPEDYVNPLNRWDQAGIKLVSHTNVGSGADDFKKSLQDEGAVVVYLGHSALDFKNKRSMGLTPKGSSNRLFERKGAARSATPSMPRTQHSKVKKPTTASSWLMVILRQ